MEGATHTSARFLRPREWLRRVGGFLARSLPGAPSEGAVLAQAGTLTAGPPQEG